MVINVSVQYNGGLFPDIIMLTLCDDIGEPFLIACRAFVPTAKFPPKHFDCLKV